MVSCASPSPPEPQALEPTASTAASDAGWLARAERRIEQLEYGASRNGQGLQAPNRVHAFRTYFTPGGIRVVERAAEGRELLALRVAGLGRGAALAAVPEGAVSSEGARIEIRRPGLVEWYENSTKGLEQGFTLPRRPPGTGDLVLELTVEGASASLRERAVIFETAAARRLVYDGLAVEDAAGRALPARFELEGSGGVRLFIDDAAAAYPVVIDPLLTSAPDLQLEPVIQNGAQAGFNVAGAGDLNGDGFADLVVGAPYYDGGETDEGAAFVFLGGATPIARLVARLESDQEGARFGWSVAGAGDVNGDGYADLVVGALRYDAGELREGAAFVFHGSAAGISDGGPATAASRLESNAAGAALGTSVAGAGDVDGDGYDDVVVGAPFYYDFTAIGAVFVFHGSAAGIPDGSPATAATRLGSDHGGSFGSSVAGAGDVNGDGYADLIVGASQYDAGEVEEGTAFVFHGSAAGISDGGPPTAASRLESNQAGAALGTSVAGAGDVDGDGYADVIVGAPEYTGASGRGAAFVFRGGPAGVADGDPATAASRLESDQPATRSWGTSVAGAGDVNGDGYADVILGAPFYDTQRERRGQGAAFLFLGSAAGIAGGGPATAAARIDSIDSWEGYVGMASSVAGVGDLDGDGYADVVVGHPRYPTEVARGAAVLALGGPHVGKAAIRSEQRDAHLGAVAGAGDVNGDGYDDVVVAAPLYDAGEPSEGAVFVFHGSASGIPGGGPWAAATRIVGGEAQVFLGLSVAGAGDVNGDGYADVIVGAAHAGTGAAFVFHGSPTGIPDGMAATAATRLESTQSASDFGTSVAAAGDVNGDGYADVIVGDPQDPDLLEAGVAFVFHGGPAGIPDGSPATAATQIESDVEASELGWSVAGAGDVNGDGYADVIVGAPGYNSPRGAAFVLLGSASGISPDLGTSTRLEVASGTDSFGFGVAGGGDVNGDGYDDVIVGAGQVGTAEAGAFLFHGSATGFPSASPPPPAAHFEMDQIYTGGLSVAGVGDVNGDGYADVVVGSPFYEVTEREDGVAFLLHGGPAGIASGGPEVAAARWAVNQPYGWFGWRVAGAGDVNGDGRADVIVSAPLFDSEETDEGIAVVFLAEPRRRVGLAFGLALLIALARRRER